MGLIQRFDIREFKRIYGLANFVETGTFLGDAVEYAVQCGFDRVFSCEIDQETATKARARFANLGDRVRIDNVDSATFLKSIVDLPDPCLFWLDAHFPGADIHSKPYDAEQDYDLRMPLHSELEVLAGRIATGKDMFVIDDMWLFESHPDIKSGPIDSHMLRHGFFKTKEDVDRLVDRSRYGGATFIDKAFADSHTLVKHRQLDNGYYIAVPKGIAS